MLRWSLMLFALSFIERTVGRPHAVNGSTAIAKISFILAMGLLVLFYRTNHARGKSNQ